MSTARSFACSLNSIFASSLLAPISYHQYNTQNTSRLEPIPVVSFRNEQLECFSPTIPFRGLVISRFLNQYDVCADICAFYRLPAKTGTGLQEERDSSEKGPLLAASGILQVRDQSVQSPPEEKASARHHQALEGPAPVMRSAAATTPLQ